MQLRINSRGLVGIGDVTFAPFGQGQNPNLAPTKSPLQLSKAVAVSKPAASSATSLLLSTPLTKPVVVPTATQPKASAPSVVAPPPAAGCGPEPARKQVGITRPFVDLAQGNQWLACMDRANAATAAAAAQAAAPPLPVVADPLPAAQGSAPTAGGGASVDPGTAAAAAAAPATVQGPVVPASSTETSTGLYVAVGVATVAVGAALYFALR